MVAHRFFDAAMLTRLHTVPIDDASGPLSVALSRP